MQKMIMLTEKEWEELPLKIAQSLHAHSVKHYGFKIVSRDGGREITDRLEDWFAGTVGMAFLDATKPD